MSTSQRMNELSRDAMQASNEGRHDDALFKLLQAGRMAKALSLPIQEAAIRNNMSIVHQMAGNMDEARSCLRIAARLLNGASPGENHIAASIAANLARIEKFTAGRAVA